MRVALLACSILCFLCQALLTCSPENYTLYVQRRGCSSCVAINTTICSGFCYSQDTNLKGQMGKRPKQQRVCVYQKLAYLAAVLPGCHPDVDPLYFYPKALHCHCNYCNSSNSECVSKAKGFSTTCSQSPRGLGLDLARRNKSVDP